MSANTNAALAASIAGGYLLGRSGKGKVALAVATYVASRKLQCGSRESAPDGEGTSGTVSPSFPSSPLSHLSEQVRTDLLSVGREAVKAALNQRLDAFADTLADRTKALQQGPETDEGEGDDEPESSGKAREPGEDEDSAWSSKKERAQKRSTKSAASSSRKSTGEKSAKKAERTQPLNEGAKRAVRAAKYSSAEKSEKTRRRR